MAMIIETGDDGTLTLPVEALGQTSPRTRYSVERLGEEVILRLSEPVASAQGKPKRKRSRKKLSSDEWWAQWQVLTEQVSAAWQSDKSAVEIVSEMRR